MILLASLGAWGATAKFCFDIQTDYTDLGGDHWPTNEPRPARGVVWEVQQGGVTQTGVLDASGCGTATVNTTQSWRARVTSEADYKNVELRSWTGSCHPTDSPEVSPWFQRAAGNLTPIEEAVGPSPRWRNLAIALWAIHRNHHGIGDPSGVLGTNRACCLDGNPAYQSDGTCSTGISDYVPVQGPVYLYANPIPEFADWIWDCSDPQYPAYLVDNDTQSTLAGFRALNIRDVETTKRTLVAHEFGHLVTSLRMGWSDEWALDAALDGCMGDYANNGDPADWPGQHRRGEFTKEHYSAAIREGYADFYSAWLWNNRTQSDCVFDMWTLHDFDLDCDPDDFFGSGDPRNGRVDCAQDWEVEVADAGDPTTPYSDGQNWLKDLQAAADSRTVTSGYACAAPPAGSAVGCVSDPNTSQHRATIMDFAKFFWKLNQAGAGGLEPEEVTALYIDTCPRGWATVGNVGFWDPSHPRQRIYLSATANGVSTEVGVYDDYFLP